MKGECQLSGVVGGGGGFAMRLILQMLGKTANQIQLLLQDGTAASRMKKIYWVTLKWTKSKNSKAHLPPLALQYPFYCPLLANPNKEPADKA